MDNYALVSGQGAIASINYDSYGEAIIEHVQDFSHSAKSVFSNVLKFPSWESAFEMSKRLLVRGYSYQIVSADDQVMLKRVYTYMHHDMFANLFLQLEEKERILDLQDQYIQRDDTYYDAGEDWADDYDPNEDEEVLLAQADAEADEAYREAMGIDPYYDSALEYADAAPSGWTSIDTSVQTVEIDGMAIEIDPVPAA